MKVVMPQIGMTMQEGTISKWFKAAGEHIQKGEPMMELTTEKLTNEIEAPATGTFQPISAEGDIVPCGEEIAEIIE